MKRNYNMETNRQKLEEDVVHLRRLMDNEVYPPESHIHLILPMIIPYEEDSKTSP